MSAAALLVDLAGDGVLLRVDGAALRYRAPAGAMTAGRLARLREHKAEIVRLAADPDALRLAAAVAIFDAGPSPSGAPAPRPASCFACGTAGAPDERGCLVCHPRAGGRRG